VTEEQARTGPADSDHPRPRRRRRWIAVTGLLVIVGYLASRGGASVGLFRSAVAHDRFVRTYDAAMAELPQPDETLDLRTRYGMVRAYRFDGADPDLAPLVLLPGRASASPVWADNLPSLLGVRTVWTLDLLGEPGMSIQARPIQDDADQARWLAEALAQLPADEVHLLGMSIGGWTAMNLAVREPEKIASVILLDPVFTFANLSPEAIMRSILISVSWFPKSWRDSFISWTAGGAPVEDEPIADMIEAGMQSYRLALPAPSRFSEQQLAGVDLPVLAIIAGESPMHDAAAAATFADRVLADGRIEVYPDASHAINGEYPRRIAADVATFLDNVSQAASP
jgi:pimeloyl-ACP methyl ester carboxylesterase